jgi:antitoxin (DNA-binding transcriptional repressor) of toxin-antitoxin stability system
MRDLRNHGREVIDRVVSGESLTITRLGRPVAELRPMPKPGRDASALLARWRHLPQIEGRDIRRDLDETIDAAL